MKKKTKWILISILTLLIVLFGLHRFYIYIQQDLWSGEQAAVVRAQQEAGISDVKKVYKSVWDEVCWVVEGKDESGQAVMVWIQEGKESRVVPLSEGTTEAQVKAIIHERFPEIDIVRLVPGIYNDQLVWQLFYKENAHHYYRFYNFSSGEPLSEVFTLPNR
ncbi:uncharacterized protein YpmB [Paenibacillus anaericanus]|uniref:Cell wall elongation regulator TseB-like domain-containing protein n=1 Tax=Paenibacillus anaericanus TaxID=170367 RepID=A0A433YCL8_9BACL|nr:DUF5590 domain-containing protein [Paenibacillus anaericanus]MDQ0088052.1 uncharacterized protein YpmB [Paenibacillus anaericanus]RUT47613.1 hypothetical protein EJP82_04320 [Paenibacillus anaericanus]